LPRFAGQVGAGERPALLADYRLATKLLAWGAFFPLAFLACKAGEFTVMVFGAQLSEAAPLVPMLSLGGAIGAVALVGSTVIYAEGKAAFIFRSGIAGALLVAVAGLSIVPAWGIYGAAFVRVLVQGLLVLAGAIYIRRLGYRFPIKAVLMCMLAAAAACIFPLLLPAPIDIHLLALAWRFLSGGAIYAGISLCVPIFETGERSRLAASLRALRGANVASL
jgi:O-antigen/teichoic acid export membrane protein